MTPVDYTDAVVSKYQQPVGGSKSTFMVHLAMLVWWFNKRVSNPRVFNDWFPSKMDVCFLPIFGIISEISRWSSQHFAGSKKANDKLRGVVKGKIWQNPQRQQQLTLLPHGLCWMSSWPRSSICPSSEMVRPSIFIKTSSGGCFQGIIPIIFSMIFYDSLRFPGTQPGRLSSYPTFPCLRKPRN